MVTGAEIDHTKSKYVEEIDESGAQDCECRLFGVRYDYAFVGKSMEDRNSTLS